MSVVPSGTSRVPAHPAADLDRKIWRRIEDEFVHGPEQPDEIDGRLEELDRESNA